MQIKEFSMKNKNIKDAEAIHLSSSLKGIEKLRLYKCTITTFGFTVIVNEIENLVEPVRMYNKALNGNNLLFSNLLYFVFCYFKLLAFN